MNRLFVYLAVTSEFTLTYYKGTSGLEGNLIEFLIDYSTLYIQVSLFVPI